MPSTHPENHRLGSDRPRNTLDEDEFGLARIVRALAETIGSSLSPAGYVLGLQGKWGSGKTTFAHFVAAEIKKSMPATRVLQFDPWLIGERTAFLPALLGRLAAEVQTVEDHLTPWYRLDYWLFRRWRKTLATKIRQLGRYAVVLAEPAQAVAIGDASRVAYAVALGLKGIGWLATILGPEDQGISKLKASVDQGLRKLALRSPNLRFVVFVDDTDRLEPDEATEILRIIRHAADFPLVAYVVCHDETVLAEQLNNSLGITTGQRYLQKIFQSTVSVPPQEPFALRRYARKLLSDRFPDPMAVIKQSGNSGYRLQNVLDSWGGALLHTPRDVVRLVEAVEFGWPWLPKGADFADFVWLQLIKLNAPKLFDWTQRYLTNVASYRDRGRPTDGDDRKLADELVSVMQEIGWQRSSGYLLDIQLILPGVGSFRLDGDKAKVFEFSGGELARFEQAGRLGSPSHWRNYFAFAFPTYAVTDEDLTNFRTAAERQDGSAVTVLRDLNVRSHAVKGHFVELLIDRLADLPPGALGISEADGTARALAASMDELAVDSEVTDFGRSLAWSRAVKLVKRSDSENFIRLIEAGEALNWMANVLRDQGFAHGIPEPSRADHNNQWLSKDQLAKASEGLIVRLKRRGIDAVFAMPQPLDVLFFWLQLGPPGDVVEAVKATIESDKGLIIALEGMRSWSSSSETGVSRPLNREYVNQFANASEALVRLQRISKSIGPMAKRANDLLNVWREAD